MVAGFRVGGNDPGIYYSNGDTWTIRKGLDPSDAKINNDE